MLFPRPSRTSYVIASAIALAWAGFAIVSGRMWPHETTAPPDNFVRSLFLGLVLALAASWWFALRTKLGVAISRGELTRIVALGCVGLVFAGVGLVGMRL